MKPWLKKCRLSKGFLRVCKLLGIRMDAPLNCMFDTNEFNRIHKEDISLQSLIGRIEAHATHVQWDELNATKDPKLRTSLTQVFTDVVVDSIPTDSFVLDVTGLDKARLGGDRVVPTSSAVWGLSDWDQSGWCAEDNLYSTLKSELDNLNKSKPNNKQDALIAETSIKRGYVLVTNDGHLAQVTKKYGGKCLTIYEILDKYAR